MSQVSVSTPFNIDLQFEVASLPKRLLAWLIDLAIILMYARGIRVFLGALFSGKGYSIGLDLLCVSMPMMLYPLVMETAFQGQSFGKRLMGLRVISLDHGAPGIGQYLIRWIFRIWEWPLVFGFLRMDDWGLFFQVLLTGIMGIGVIITIAMTNNSQRFGDLAAGTAVVNLRENYSLSDTIFQEVVHSSYQVVFPQVIRLNDRDINAIKTVINQLKKKGNMETALRVSHKIKEVLHIESELPVPDFLDQLMSDYNYLATREKFAP